MYLVICLLLRYAVLNSLKLLNGRTRTVQIHNFLSYLLVNEESKF